jgi:aminoglycoside phosphotransferase family enzyme
LATTALPSTEEKVRFLSAPDSYADRPARLDVVETHLSWVFLAGERVYKLKKPVSSEHFDFTSLTARETNCRNEVRLNRRLAGDVYQRVARLGLSADGRLALDGEGETVDWLVVMRRLPADRMLDELIQRSAVDSEELARLGERLSHFYASRPPAEVEPQAYLDRFVQEQATNRRVLKACHAPASHERLLGRLDAALVRHARLLELRVLSGRIVDGHGDLRPEHVCMTEPIVIFDCLEFSDRLRRVDPVDELAFLGLECGLLGADWIGPAIAEQVLRALGQSVSEDLAALHVACRALFRMRVMLAHLLDPVPREPEKWRPLADRYAAAADAALSKLAI